MSTNPIPIQTASRPPAMIAGGGEADLVARARSGDREAFEALYRAHVGRVFAVCLRLAADRSLAEELTQAAFIRAWRRLPGFRGDAAFSTWMHRIAVNGALEELRARARREARIEPVEDLTEFDRGVPADPAAALDLDRAIATLPAGARTVFVLHDVEGFAHDEIAELTGVAVGTSKAQLHRARRLLREVLR